MQDERQGICGFLRSRGGSEERCKMTDEKICPIMSRPIMMTKYTDMGDNVHAEETEAIFKEVQCLKEKCMAWVPECSRNDGNCDCTGEVCLDNDREYLECNGGCRLI
jgi:hypothetical protein